MTEKKDGEPSTSGPALWHLPADANAAPAESLGEIRDNIDRIDRAVVTLLAERLRYTRAAARFKANPREVAAPARVEEVIAKIRSLAAEHGLPPEIAEAAYRPLVAGYIADQQRLFDRISAKPKS